MHLSRTRVILFTCLIGLFMLLVTPVFAEPKPNIIYILLDDAGWGDLGCYGQQKLPTPNMDRLAAEGMRFTQHYSGSTVCAPTRCVLMTGLHTGHAHVRGNGGDPHSSEGEIPIPADTITLAELLKKAGYAVGGFGKWGLGGPESDGNPIKQGFDEFFGYYDQGYAHDFYPRWLWHNNRKIELDRAKYSHTLIMNEAFRFIRENRDRPFFCYLPVTIPHAAMQAPEPIHNRFRKKYPQFDDKVGTYGGDDRRTKVQNPIAGFAAMMTIMDQDVGRLLELLQQLDLDKNTLVMLSSDNGPHHEGGHDPKFWDSNGPFKGTKRDLYEGGVRVPFLVRWPGKIKAGAVNDTLSAHWDILPTFCDLAGIEVPNKTDGISLVPVFLGRVLPQPHEFLYWEFYERGGKRAVRFDKWKAVQLNLHENLDSPVELYNLAEDPGEINNIADRHPDKVRQAKEYFRQAHTPNPIWHFRAQKK